MEKRFQNNVLVGSAARIKEKALSIKSRNKIYTGFKKDVIVNNN